MRVILEDRESGYKMVEAYGLYCWGNGTSGDYRFTCSPYTVLKFGVPLDPPESPEVPPEISEFIESNIDSFLSECGKKRLPDTDYWGTETYGDWPPMMETERVG